MNFADVTGDGVMESIGRFSFPPFWRAIDLVSRRSENDRTRLTLQEFNKTYFTWSQIAIRISNFNISSASFSVAENGRECHA